jgi:serine phosphatase RsbU (regulator of sigma subunit)
MWIVWTAHGQTSSPQRRRPLSTPPDAVQGVVGDDLSALLTLTADLGPSDLVEVVDVVALVAGAESGRVLLADYGLVSMHELGTDGRTGAGQPIEGTMAGRAFATGETVVSDQGPTVWLPLAEGSERLGVLELTHASWTDELGDRLAPVLRILVLVLVSKRRYTDVLLQSRRSQPLSLAAEIQWDLLPPLTCSTEQVSVSGILEPAYSIGGDSFDYAFNPGRVEFAILDAVGHGMPAVSMASLAINGLRNARREGHDLETAYYDTGAAIEAQFGDSNFVTGQLGRLDTETGELTWLNAGHPPPVLVRGNSYVGELVCAPSMPMGLGGSVTEIATERLQPGDRVLFFTDGVTETRSPEGEEFGVERLADLLVRATHDRLPPAETLRRLASSIFRPDASGLSDDATLLIVEFHGPAADG